LFLHFSFVFTHCSGVPIKHDDTEGWNNGLSYKRIESRKSSSDRFKIGADVLDIQIRHFYLE